MYAVIAVRTKQWQALNILYPIFSPRRAASKRTKSVFFFFIFFSQGILSLQ